MMNREEYQKKYEAYQKGLITDKEWKQICDEQLDNILEINKDTLKRLKHV